MQQASQSGLQFIGQLISVGMAFNASAIRLVYGNERSDAAGDALYRHPVTLTFGDLV